MNTHKHARLTFARRLEMVQQMTIHGQDAAQAALAQGVTAQTARKWLGRYLSGGERAQVQRLCEDVEQATGHTVKLAWADQGGLHG